jgi:hypothetical protein
LHNSEGTGANSALLISAVHQGQRGDWLPLPERH